MKNYILVVIYVFISFTGIANAQNTRCKDMPKKKLFKKINKFIERGDTDSKKLEYLIDCALYQEPNNTSLNRAKASILGSRAYELLTNKSYLAGHKKVALAVQYYKKSAPVMLTQDVSYDIFSIYYNAFIALKDGYGDIMTCGVTCKTYAAAAYPYGKFVLDKRLDAFYLGHTENAISELDKYFPSLASTYQPINVSNERNYGKPRSSIEDALAVIIAGAAVIGGAKLAYESLSTDENSSNEDVRKPTNYNNYEYINGDTYSSITGSSSSESSLSLSISDNGIFSTTVNESDYSVTYTDAYGEEDTSFDPYNDSLTDVAINSFSLPITVTIRYRKPYENRHKIVQVKFNEGGVYTLSIF